MKIGIACAFRHNPAEDGLMIPASTAIDPTLDDDGQMKNPGVFPIVGYLAYSVGGKAFWSFAKYEAPILWDASWKREDQRARLATCRVADLHCPECGASSPFPVWGEKEKIRCPYCGKKGVDVHFIKERDQRFFEMVGDLKDPLEQAAKAAAADPAATEFAFPTLVVGGTNVKPSASGLIPPEIQGKAQANGMGLKEATSVSLETLKLVEDGSLSLLPGIFSGVLDREAVKDGWSKTEGCVTQFMKAFVPEVKPNGPIPFRTIRF